jgi:hypothetical protein
VLLAAVVAVNAANRATGRLPRTSTSAFTRACESCSARRIRTSPNDLSGPVNKKNQRKRP